MRLERKNLDEPVEVVCRLVAAEHLAKASLAVDRMADQEDAGALHDFRVNIRRTCTCIDAYGAHFSKRIRQDYFKQLRQLITLTGPGRDLEVQRAWLRTQLSNRRLPALVREGFELASERMGPVATDEPRTNVVESFQRVSGRLVKRFEKTNQSIALGSDGAPMAFRMVTGDLVASHIERLSKALDRVQTATQRKRAHQARLIVKRLRYIVEPLGPVVVGTRDIVNRLKGLQDVLGDLRDLHLLEQVMKAFLLESAEEWGQALINTASSEARLAAITAHSRGGHTAQALAAGLQRIHQHQTRLFDSLSSKWHGEHQNGFLERVGRLTSRLCDLPESTVANAAAETPTLHQNPDPPIDLETSAPRTYEAPQGSSVAAAKTRFSGQRSSQPKG